MLRRNHRPMNGPWHCYGSRRIRLHITLEAGFLKVDFLCMYRVFIVFFLNSASSAAALVFDLPLCTHTDTEGKPKEARVRNIFQNLRKNTIFNEKNVR